MRLTSLRLLSGQSTNKSRFNLIVHNSVILYVDNVEASTAFYKAILGEGPSEAFPGFSVFSLKDVLF